MSCTEGLCSGVYRAASDGGQPGDSACQVCLLNTASSYSVLPSSSAAVWCLFYVDKETMAPRAKSTELGFHPRPPCLEDQLPAGAWGALTGPCRAQARAFQSSLRAQHDLKHYRSSMRQQARLDPDI